MKPLAKVLGSILDTTQLDNETQSRRRIAREWDRQRSLAISPSDRAEIDAIFSRNL